jgi:hypothetical protein
MGRYQYTTYDKTTLPRFIAIWDLQWALIEHTRVAPGCDLSAAMSAAIQRIESEGWQAEGQPTFGFVFIARAGERRLLMLTPRDPLCSAQQSFSPFHSS